ncbi:TM0106 family RecB-like putative nuclease [Polaribacter sp. BAL334]|uniref:TM0106 family RecB-like putative nuclease n=1 Tax=Polaribacter sp. BAL334 TaxID=1708178 RepID=UPI0018D266DA|nr:TM0106 family RecB-like putative nuclease [Polaribacter sp. BAL334]MBG7613181.1 TM0106 family RecB-like putative nuclease [Polaribacter sp. BAL334]
MRKSNNQIIFSASDLSDHIHCKHLTNLNYDVVQDLKEKPINYNRVLDVLRERGIDFENSFLIELETKGLSIVKINSEELNAKQKTIEAMRQGADYIYQARLSNEKWQGWADFLIKVATPSALGNWSYEVIDTKLSTQTRAGTILQISLYSEIIEEIQGLLPEYMHVKTPESELSYRVNDYISYLRLIKKRLDNAINTPIATYPEPCSHCDICNWWQHCNSIRREDDHLSFIAGMGTSQIKEVKQHGITKLQAMSELTLPIPFKPTKGSKETYTKLREQARVQNETRTTQKPIYEVLELIENTGFYNLPEPSDGDIYLDFEGDPLVEPSGLEYLFGWVFQKEYHCIWVSNLEEEKAALEQFIDFVFDKRKEFAGLHIYHYAPYETIALKRMMGKYAIKENEIDILLRTKSFIDLHRVLKQSIRAGVERYSLKDLEVYHGFVREMDLRTLSKFKADYEFLLESKKFELITEEMKAAIQLYNQDDCYSTLNLHLWLEKERALLITNGQVIERPIENTVEVPDSVTAHLERITPIYDALMKDIPLDINERNKEQQARFILANMLDWYRREQKSFWWEYYRILELEPDELLDEKSTLTYLQFTGQSVPDKRSFIDTYTFPSQECELRPGNKVKIEDGKTLMEIIEIDELHGIVKIKKGPSIKDIHPNTIIKFEQFSTKDKEEALIQFAEWILANGFENSQSDYKVTRDLLLNTLPNLLQPIIDTTDLVAKSIDWASKLNNSYLPIQGPPGSGKSYTGSHMVLELIKKGKKIGITALSHKVIINLLDKVQKLAIKQGIDISIIYKGSSNDDGDYSWEMAKNIDTIVTNIAKYQVIAGTSFMWCNENLKNKVDYLIIDEAGQFALIDTLVVTQASKNIVFLGDHQQLKQPMKGVHPDGTDVSALEHLLEGKKTISKEKGIFLEKTYRMHPSICFFDSEMFYESRLKSVDGLEHQRVEGNTEFQGSGLFYKSIIHEGNTNFSLEEIEVIEKITTELTKGDVFWYDDQNIKRALQSTDIKIITPYNSSVFELQKKIPTIEIGTVDKFQGQEAAVIIYSLASSSPEDAPRGMDFLYSPNRFNVAVSRAKAIFIMVGSPKIFEPDCKSPEQIKLANPFCRFIELAETK